MEKRVAADTQELERARNKMREKEKLAVIGEFAAGIVHEIRSPLSTLSMTLDYMRGLSVPASVEKRLELAADESIGWKGCCVESCYTQNLTIWR